MKIIHCADIHLDSALSSNFTAKQAEMRRSELLLTFTDMVEYGALHNVRAVIIAGDLFDEVRISMRAKNVVRECIKKNPGMDFLYLAGNHDEEALLGEFSAFENFKMFDDNKVSYRYGNVVITSLPDGQKLAPEDVNIVVRHMELKSPEMFAGRNIDYLALGHIHKHIEGRLDSRGVYCYSGCLEARGFDECGEQGFVEIDINSDGLRYRYVPFGRRRAWRIQVDVNDAGKWDAAGIEGNFDDEMGIGSISLCESIEKAAAHISSKDMLCVRLVGDIMPDNDINKDYIKEYFKDKFYLFRLEDKTTLKIDIEKLKKEHSLRADFIKNVMESDETEETKKSIILCGIKALAGEVIDECG